MKKKEALERIDELSKELDSLKEELSAPRVREVENQFIIGEYYKHCNHSGVIEATGLSDGGNNISGILVEKGSCTYDVGHKGHQWGMQYLTHLPNYKKEFKVGDWVEVVGSLSHGFAIGDVGKITEEYPVSKYQNKSYSVKVGDCNQDLLEKQLKHTTKPKEQPLMFGDHEVTIQNNLIKVGCKSFTPGRLQAFLLVCEEIEGNTTLNYAHEFLKDNRTKLGL